MSTVPNTTALLRNHAAMAPSIVGGLMYHSLAHLLGAMMLTIWVGSLAAQETRPPYLAKARYAAEFNGTALVNGSGTWTLIQSDDAAAVLPVPELNLALNTITVDSKEGVLADFNGAGLGLLLEKSGTHTCTFRWTCGGLRAADITQIDLRLPPTPVCSLDLLIPVDHYVVENSGKALLVGPGPAADPKQRLWRIHSSGVNHLQFSIAKGTQPGSGPLVLAQVHSAQQLLPHTLMTQFDFQIEVLHHWVDRLVFDLTGEIDPYDVVLPDQELKSWGILPGIGGAGKTLVVSFYRPIRGLIKDLQIRCLSPLPTKGTWSSPAIKLRSATIRSETIALSLHSDLQLENWQSGGFQLVDSRLKIDGSHQLKLAAANGDLAGQRPSGVLKTHEAQFTAEQQVRWEIAPPVMTLHCDTELQVLRGGVSQLALKLPPPNNPQDWQVQSVRTEPKELARGWQVVGPQLLIDLHQPLGARESAQFNIVLQRDLKTTPGASLTLDFPDLPPIGGQVRFGGYAVQVNPSYRADVLQSTLSPATQPRGDSAALAQFYGNFRAQPVTGKLRITPQLARARVQLQANVLLGQEAAELSWSAAIEPLTGNPAGATLFLSPASTPLELVSSTVPGTTLRPLPDIAALMLLGGQHGLNRLAWQQAVSPGQWQQLVFAEPLRKPETLHFKSRLAAPRSEVDGFTLDVPLLHFTDVERLRSDTVVGLQHAQLLDSQVVGFDELPAAHAAAPGQAVRLYRAHPDALSRLLLNWQASPDSAVNRFIDHTILHTFVEPGGRLVHHFSCGIWEWPASELTIILPPETRQLLAVKADGRWVTALHKVVHSDGIHLKLPLGRFRHERALEVVYSTDSELGWTGCGTLHAAAPKLPVNPLSTRHVWHLPRGIMPLFRNQYKPLSGSDASNIVSVQDLWRAGDDWGSAPAKRTPTDSPAAATEWTAWEALTSAAPSENFAVVASAITDRFGLIVVSFCLLASWRLRNSFTPHWRFRLWAIWLTAALAALVWLPPVLRFSSWSMLAAVLLVGLAWLLRLVFIVPPREKALSQTATAVTATLLVLAFVLSSPCAHSAPYTNEAVVVSAEYQGHVEVGSADFTATYRIYSFDDDSFLTLPLIGVDLFEGSRLNDELIFPIAALKPKTGYRIPVPQKGFHELRLGFRVRLAQILDAQTVQFNVPKAASCKLELKLPESHREITALRSLGNQSVAILADKSQLLKAELGPTNLLQVRWRQASATAAAVHLLVRESYFWDLRPAETVLIAIYDYQIKSGLVTSLQIEVPDELDVRSVKANEALTSGIGPQLEDWRILDGKDRRLNLAFARPVVGEVRIQVEFVPRTILGSDNITLRLPFPLRLKDLKSFQDGILAYRLPDGVQVKETRQNLAVLDLAPQAAAKEWQAVFTRQPGPPTNALTFQRTLDSAAKSAAPNAALHLTLSRPRPIVSEEVLWRIHAEHADLAASYRINAPEDSGARPLTEPILLELDTPKDFMLARVTGPNVLYWNRVDSQTQIWLKKSVGACELSLFGWVKHPLRLIPGKTGKYALPVLKFRNVESVAAQIAVDPVQGIAILPAPEASLPRTGTPLLAVGALQAAPMRPDVSLLLTAAMDDRRIQTISANLEFRIPFGSFRPLTLLARNWPDDIRIDAPKGVRVQILDTDDGNRTWRLHIAPDIARSFRLTMTSQKESAPQAHFLLPQVQVVEANHSDVLVALLDEHLQPEDMVHLQPVTDAAQALALWPQQTHNAQSVWHAAEANWSARIAPRTRPATALKSLFAEHLVGAAGDGGWLHGARILVHGRQPRAEFLLPAGAVVVAAQVNDQRVTPYFPGSSEAWLPLDKDLLLHQVQIWWRIQGENIQQPHLAAPLLRGGDALVWHETIFLPNGFQLAPQFRNSPQTIPFNRVLLRKAEAYDDATRQVLEEDMGDATLTAELALIQKAFAVLHAQLADRADSNAVATPLAAIVARNQDRLTAHGYEHFAHALDKPASDFHDRFETAWTGTPIHLLREVPALTELQLIPQAAVLREQQLFASEFIFVGLIGLWLLSLLPGRILGRLRSLWPEQLFLLTVAAWLILGPSVIGAALAAFALASRAILLVFYVSRLGRPSPNPASSFRI